MIKNKVGSSLFLFITACIWGVAFVAQSVAADYIKPFTFNFIRFLLGGIFLIPIIWIMKRNKTVEKAKEQREEKDMGIIKDKKADGKITLVGGICCGLCLCGGSLCQQYGIQFTSVGKAGFITALYIIIVPVLGIFLKKRVSVLVWLSAAVAMAGFYLLCMTEGLSVNKGDFIILIGAFIFSLHILVIDYFSPKADGVQISCVQFFTSAIICEIGTFIFDKPALTAILAAYVPLLYAGIMSCGIAYTLQIVGQKNTEPTVASLILSLESVIAVLAGWLILGQKLSFTEIIGCVLVFTAIIMAQLPTGKKKMSINKKQGF